VKEGNSMIRELLDWLEELGTVNAIVLALLVVAIIAMMTVAVYRSKPLHYRGRARR